MQNIYNFTIWLCANILYLTLSVSLQINFYSSAYCIPLTNARLKVLTNNDSNALWHALISIFFNFNSERL
jgi:hypothetical protein